MKRQNSKDFRLERKKFLKDPLISSKKKVKIIFELIQHINFYDENNKGRFKRFFRKNLEFFPKTYKNFNSIFSLDKIDGDIKKKLVYVITKDLNSVFRDRDYKDILYNFISFMIHIAIWIFITSNFTSYSFEKIFNEIFLSILFISGLYFIFSFGSLIFLSQNFYSLTRSREKARIFLCVIDKIITYTLLGFYLVSWVSIIYFIDPDFQDLNFLIQLIFVPQILFHIFQFMDQVSSHKIGSYDKFFLYLTHLIILSKSRYKYSYDIPFFFKKLLDCLNQEFIHNFNMRIKNQEEIESKFLRYFFTRDILNFRLFGYKLEMIYNEIEDEEIHFGNHLSSEFLKTIIVTIEEFSELIGQKKFEFANITDWEKVFMRSEKNTLTNKMIYPLIMGSLIALISFLISLAF